MMKKFLTVVLGSFVGVWIAMIVMTISSIVVSFALVGSMMEFSGGSKTIVEDKSILVIDLGTALSEQASESDLFDMVMDKSTGKMSLHDVLSALEDAADNDKIKGVYLKCSGGGNGTASLYELRKAIVDFKGSGKPVYAYGYSAITQGDYYVATAADSVFVNPVGMLDVHGLASVNMMFKNLLDKIGVEMQVIRVGTYKSAVEPYILSEISEANRKQQEHYMGNIWKTLVEDMAKSRNMSADSLNLLADEVLISKSTDFLMEKGLIDGVCYRKEMEQKLKAMADLSDDDDLRMVTPKDIKPKSSKGDSKTQIALLYAEGEIDASAGYNEDGIDSEELCESIYELRDDENVKALVLRVNSPGGSAFGSEQIWKALEDFKAADKLLVVSMGDLAASGGYYISCGAKRIFAEPVTITGSIGIFGVIPCLEDVLKDKIGVTQSVVKTNANGEFGSMALRMTPAQRDAMQEYVNQGYELFTSRCAQGRGKTQDEIKAIAEGRVWEGITAKEIGLVDEFGSLKDAIAYAASELGVSDYMLKEPKAPKTSFEKMMDKYLETRYANKMRKEMGVFYELHEQAQRMLNRDKVLCLMETVEIK